MLLLNRDCVSAPELARRFEVSVRTIYRDFDALCEAGIPIAAYPGAGGGYGIEQGFKIDRSILKPEEIGQISATLGSISSIFGDERMRQAVDRLEAMGRTAGKADAKRPVPENYLFIELNPGRRDRERIGRIRRAVEDRRLLSLSYVDGTGATSSRQVEPLAIVFAWQAWYLYSFCRSREDFRMFKIARIAALELLPERFAQRSLDLDSRPWNEAWPESEPIVPAVIRFADGARVEEHFEAEAIEREAGGSALVHTCLPMAAWTVSYLLGLGIAFEVLEPEALRSLVAERARQLLESNVL
jgi:predicted DNA-binding transcriptional regulator YafY